MVSPGVSRTDWPTLLFMRQSPLIDNYLNVEMKQVSEQEIIVPVGGKICACRVALSL